MTELALSTRDEELIQTFVRVWLADETRTPFLLPSGGSFEHPGWPADVRVPSRDEARRLNHAEYLAVDPSVSPHWAVFPTDEAIELAGSGAEERDALRDPDARLAAILEATVAAHNQDPSEPLYMNELDHADQVMDQRWSLHPEAARFHDLAQLEDLGLVSSRPSGEGAIQFWPTPRGRQAVMDPAKVLEDTADQADDQETASRLRKWADRARAGDVAVSASGSSIAHVIRALLEAGG